VCPCQDAVLMSRPWDPAECAALAAELGRLRDDLRAQARRHAARRGAVHAHHAASALNLQHYLALRRHDLRPLQVRLAALGLSSLGRAESHVLASIDKVLGLLSVLTGQPWQRRDRSEPAGAYRGPALLARNAEALLGPNPPQRTVRIMVTLPATAVQDPALLRRWVDAGMDIARINCAHDDAATWQALADAARSAARHAGRPLQVLMDLGGPKLRTGAIEPDAPILRLRPQRDARGRVLAPAVLLLHGPGGAPPAASAQAMLPADPAWLARLRPGETLTLTDTRGAHRTLQVVACSAGHAVLHARKTVYLEPGLRLRRQALTADPGDIAPLPDWPPQPARLRLHAGDKLQLCATGLGRPAQGRQPARVPVTLPEALDALRPGHAVWFDDGRIGGQVLFRRGRCITLRLDHVRNGGDTLAADRGINLPDSALDLPALTAADLRDLDTVARCADLVGLSFTQCGDDVRALRQALDQRSAAHLGLMLKIETRRGFARLPDILLAALEAPRAGVMIARGDLAVECGWERLAEVQEEILWACEAAHLPVIWATQVLESLAKTGRPSRAEVTDAAMGARAECVMLNKGPHIDAAIRMLDDILRRMQAHQAKKTSLLRALRSW
jgi:pyruvate kinase